MLARTYKTHEELNIKADFLEALIEVQERLESGSIKPWDDHYNDGDYFNFAHSSVDTYSECRVGCIGAWVREILGRNVMVPSKIDHTLYRLFYNWPDRETNNPQWAAQRIDKFRRGERLL